MGASLLAVAKYIYYYSLERIVPQNPTELGGQLTLQPRPTTLYPRVLVTPVWFRPDFTM